MVYISVLSEEIIKLLHIGISHSKDKGFRNRCRAILLSDKSFSSRDIAKICDMKCQKTVCGWLKKFRELGIEGLCSKPVRGRKNIMSSLSIEQVITIIKEIELNPQSLRGVVAKLTVDFKFDISKCMLRKYIKTRLGYSWKRMRK